MTLALSVPLAASSLNSIPDRGLPFRERAAPFQAAFADQLRAVVRPARPGSVSARAVLTFRDCRRRSAENFAPLLEQALTDALVEVGWIPAGRGLALEAVAFEKGSKTATTIVLLWEPAS